MDDLEKSKLFFCTHNSTILLEALSLNFPTIILLPKYRFYTNHYLRSEAIPMIKKMKDVGIYFDDENEARKKINLIWPDIEKWWSQREIQAVVREFCEMYCKSSDNIPDELSKIIHKVGS